MTVVKQVAQKSCCVSILRNIKNLTGHETKKSVLIELTVSRGNGSHNFLNNCLSTSTIHSVLKFISARLENQVTIMQYKFIEIFVNINSKLFHYLVKILTSGSLDVNPKANTIKQKQCSQCN